MRRWDDPIEEGLTVAGDGARNGNGEDRSTSPEPNAADTEKEAEATEEQPAPEAPPDPLEQATAERDRYRDQLLRTAADFDNYRKRARRDVEEARLRGRDEMLRDLLPVLDNFERALDHAGGGGDTDAITKGLEMVMKLLQDTLVRSGVRAVDEVGVPFDPAIHDALHQDATDAHPPGTVTQVIHKGYVAGERLVRPAAVVVAVAPAPAEPAEAPPTEEEAPPSKKDD